MTLAQDLDWLKQNTGITEPALARKLGVPTALLRQAKGGGASLPVTAQEVLAAFIAQAQASVDRLVSPRQQRPHLESSLYRGEGLTLLRSLPDECVDSIVSDIPYGISLQAWDVLHDNNNTGLLGSSEAQQKAGSVFAKRRKPINGWSSADRQIPIHYYEWCKTWSAEWLRVLKPGGSVVVFAGRRLMHRCVLALEDEGFCLRDLLSWHKPKAVFRAQRLSTVLQKRGELGEARRWEGWRVGNLAPVFEPIIWCFKPYTSTLADNMLDHEVGAMDAEDFKARTGSYDNTISVGLAPGEGGLHEAQKPVALMEALIALCTPPGGLVLDPFAGSGLSLIHI